MSDPRHDLGRRAEAAAASWLVAGGWDVLATRWRCPFGELDLVCLDPHGTLVGVEVRARRSGRAGAAEESVDACRIARLRRSLAAYAAQVGPRRTGRRLDLVTLSPVPGDPDRRWRARRIPGIGVW
ncbi:MAG: YraN family protein [Candidatus Limnocylindria bacterium]